MKSLLFTTVLVLLGTLSVWSQKYGYTLLPGWTGQYVKESQYGYKTYGLNDRPKGGYAIEECNFDSALNLRSNRFDYFDSVHTTVASSFAYDEKDDSLISVTAIHFDTINDWYGRLATFSSDGNVVWQEKIKVADKTYPLQTIFTNSRRYVFGVYQNGDSGLKSFLQVKYGDSVIVRKYGCHIFTKYGGCNLFFNHAIQTPDSGFIMAFDIGARGASYYGELQDCYLVKTDSNGIIQWTKTISSSKFSYFDIHVAPLKNGNYLAIWTDRYYKPYMSPDKNRLPIFYDTATLLLAEFDIKGNIERQWNLMDKIENIGRFKQKFPFISKISFDIDSTILVCGWTANNSQGFLLNLNNRQGDFNWYREYEMNISEPYSGSESLRLKNITKTSRGYALIGEYISHPSDSFPDGIQTGVLMLVDEIGCQFAGCDTLVSIEAKDLDNSFTIYPNPSSGVISISPNSSHLEFFNVVIYNNYGKIISRAKCNKACQLYITDPGIYFLRIISDSNIYYIKKLIIER